MRMLYAYAGEDNVGYGSPHAIQLELSDEDALRWAEQRGFDSSRLGTYDVGSYIEVTDQATMKAWRIASAPCGLGCHCAAVAVPA